MSTLECQDRPCFLTMPNNSDCEFQCLQSGERCERYSKILDANEPGAVERVIELMNAETINGEW